MIFIDTQQIAESITQAGARIGDGIIGAARIFACIFSLAYVTVRLALRK